METGDEEAFDEAIDIEEVATESEFLTQCWQIACDKGNLFKAIIILNTSNTQ